MLGNCADYAAEKTAFQWLLVNRGHIPGMSPKCHPEIAGVGIEYSWGKSKQYFRRHTDHVGSNLRSNIKKSIDKTNLTLVRVRKYARKSRSYRRACEGKAKMGYADIEKLVKTFKNHRGADQQDTAFIEQS